MRPLEIVDYFLNRLTMYRLTFYSLLILWAAGAVFAMLGLMPFGIVDFFISFAVLFLTCLLANWLFAAAFKAPTNVESVYITALILSLIVSPVNSVNGIFFLMFAGLLSIASKYLLAIRKKHLFNPAAFAVAATALATGHYASWWIGNLFMAPLVLAAGLLITRKLQRFDLVLSFFAVALGLTFGYAEFLHQQVALIIREELVYSPLLFFGFVMLTEPATTPPRRVSRMWYGAVVGFLFAPIAHVGSFYMSPELALLAGNVVSYAVSPKGKFILTLKEKVKVARDTYEFIFVPPRRLVFAPGQYLEWTLAHEKKDTRGIRRYFTIASSPTESDVKVGVKFYEKPSSYKRALESLQPGAAIIASQLAGDFTLPEDPSRKLLFLAGGIGVTPFRSMIKYLVDCNERRDIVMLYANKGYEDIAYREIFDAAARRLGIRTVYFLSDTHHIPLSFPYESGLVDGEALTRLVPDYRERMCYISGPRTMITSFQHTLAALEMPRSHIKTDFFPGFA